MLRLAIQPPQQASPGAPLYPPLAARLSSDTSIFSELSQIWAVATLIHYSGEVLHDQLGGRVADSAHPLPDGGHGTSSSTSSSSDRDRAYFYFPDLVIHEPGRYRVRVSLMQMDYSPDGSTEGVVRVLESVDSRSITVEDGAVNHSRPSKYTSKRTLKC
jgi:Velvet factor